jgi:ATP-binding cassette subfamily B protein
MLFLVGAYLPALERRPTQVPSATSLDNFDLIERYTDQPARLPGELRRELLGLTRSAPEIAYAFIDLNDELQLDERWLVLTGGELALCRAGTAPIVYARSTLGSASIERGLSCNVLRVARGPAEHPIVLQYTQRQRGAVERLVALLEGASVSGPTDADEAYASFVVRPIREAQASVSKNGIFIIIRLLRYLLPYRKELTLGLASAGVITLCALIPPYITGYLVDDVLRPVQARQVASEDVTVVAWLCVVAMTVVYVLRRAAGWVRLRLMAVIGEYVARDLRRQIYEHLQTLSIAFYSRKKTGSLITRVTSDTDRLWDFLTFGVIDLSLSAVMLLGLGVVLLSLDARLGLVMLLPLPALFWAIHRNNAKMADLFTRAFRKWSAITDVLSDTIPGVRVVRAFNQHQREVSRFQHANVEATNDFNRVHAVWTAFWPAVMFVVELSILAVWTLALPRLLGESALGPPLSLGTFVSFLLYTTMFMWPIEVVGQMARIVNRATTSAQRVFEVLDTRPEIVDDERPVSIESLEGSVRFENVSFSYDGLRPTLQNMSFDVRPGEMIGLVGPSGGGKTTLVNLLARFYDVSAGRVLVDGTDIRRFDSGQYRRHVGMVLQDPYLFHGSVLDNLRYGAPGASFEEVVRAARVANAHDFVCKLPHGYDTLVGERGHTLSGGERQRISIARAVLANPRILILDEATSAVDTETERKIQEAMDRLAEGRTVFAIAHRLSTLRKASRLFVIDAGRLTECGSHVELLANAEGTYQRLHRLQQELHDPA